MPTLGPASTASAMSNVGTLTPPRASSITFGLPPRPPGVCARAATGSASRHDSANNAFMALTFIYIWMEGGSGAVGSVRGRRAALDGLPLHGLVHRGQGHDDVDRPAHPAQVTEDGPDQVRPRETHHTPVQAADHQKRGGRNVQLFHVFLKLLRLFV